MSRLTDLISKAKAKDADLGRELEREFKALSSRRSFGLNFERHRPENVELPGRPIRKGDKVRILPERGSTKKGDQRLWKVISLAGRGAERIAKLSLLYTDESEQTEALYSDLVVVAEFRDYIYPGLVSTGKVERGGDKPFHTVINGENFHALEALTFTHRGKVDAIYIDPPYNSGATDWKYNNSYVEKDDAYRHSKWLAMIERRLILARELLNPNHSVLIVTIDAREFLRLGLLLPQIFPEARIQMVSSIINPKGVSVAGGFRRADEYLFFAMLGDAAPKRLRLSKEWSPSSIVSGTSKIPELDEAEEQTSVRRTEPAWTSMMRRGSEAARADRESMFYPIYADPESRVIVEVGEALPQGVDEAPEKEGLVPILPIRRNGDQGRWQISAAELRTRIKQGRIRLGRPTSYGFVVNYLPDGAYEAVLSDTFEIEGYAHDGSIIAFQIEDGDDRIAPTQWKIESHNASEHGSGILEQLMPGRSFPFPKSLYAVEDALRFFLFDNRDAKVLDFFSGSGTTAHAVMRLNKQDGGQRQCISVTNNEASAGEQAKLREDGLRPGDPEWEQWGICDYITKPRIKAAITGQTPEGQPIKGDYKFTDEFLMADGFAENAEFFTLTYETPVAVSHNRAFERIAPLLWMRAGSAGSRIEKLPEGGWAVADCYGLLTDLDQAALFAEAIHGKDSIRIAYIVTDDERRFQSVVRQLPDTVEPVRLYESYLTNFRFATGR
ncbi:site-specific DNA-methyltransferase [Parasphingopyxis marina]|uniref:site-specific DNA-methyltransferase (adenine-specific) n=1 Tax=Parasphingopyxis marina TaxID=2761622 RepID=A0A842HZ10_9SPHN|nr:DNA methyltransferase [Parasphingopyxis marina]MBC2776734.1 site-specific DNA-methyltransferase [Parasphingopyxis marina]